MPKRILLFVMTNILVIATISIILSILGLRPYLTQHGIDYATLALTCAIWGMTGAFISLLMSKVMAKMAMGVVIIHPEHMTRMEHELLDLVYRLATKAGLKTMPEVGIYPSPEVNAFATGPSKNNSLVAVSSGLLNTMSREELEGVLAHEVSHIANGDMVTMTLVQGIINSFSLFLSRIVAYAITIAMSKDDEKGAEIAHGTYYIISFILDILFTVLGSMLVAYYSRYREFRADHGGSRLASREKMIAALTRLEYVSDIEDDRAPAFANLKIAHHPSWLDIFSSHPPLNVRIAALRNSTKFQS